MDADDPDYLPDLSRYPPEPEDDEDQNVPNNLGPKHQPDGPKPQNDGHQHEPGDQGPKEEQEQAQRVRGKT